MGFGGEAGGPIAPEAAENQASSGTENTAITLQQVVITA
jgi:hypothetical protein